MPQDKANAAIRSDNTSGYKGVSWDGRRRRWHAYITVNGKQRHLGRHADAWTAAQAFNAAAIEARGASAWLNTRRTDPR